MVNEKHLSLKSCCFPYVVVLSVLVVLLRGFSFGFSFLLGDLLTAASLIALAFAVDLYRGGDRRTGNLLVVTFIFLYFAGAEFLCSLNAMETVLPNLVASIALSFPVLLVFPLLWKMGERRMSLILATFFLVIAICFSSRDYVYSYTYLYMDITDVVSHTKWFMLLVWGVVAVVLLEFLVKSKRNILVYVLLGCGIMASFYESLLRNSLGFSVKNSGMALVSTWLPASFLALLLIYIRGEAPEKRVYERRNVVFSNMVYQELKPIKKRKKSPKFEVPPNVPKTKWDLDKDQNE